MVTSTCAACGIDFLIRAERADQKHCSRTCFNSRQVGAANPRYNGGLCLRRDGRLVIHCRDGSLMMFYRGLMAAHVGRLLRPDEIVHHLNGNPSDDRIENLALTTRAAHINIHRADLLAGKRAA